MKYEFSDYALFNELGRNSATIETAKAVYAFGCLPGHETELSDAPQAYAQTRLGNIVRGRGSTTWVRLPKDRRPKHFDKIIDPVVPLALSLYGHPDAGGDWERKCDADVKAVRLLLLTIGPQ